MYKLDLKVSDEGVLLNGIPVERPVSRMLLGVLAAVMTALGMLGMGVMLVALAAGCVLFVAVLVVLTPLWLPGNYLLRHYGRKGFMTLTEGSLALDFSSDSFRKLGGS